MTTFKRFEDIEGWQKAARTNSKDLSMYRQVVLFRDFGLKDQIRRACVSIMSNIAEGHDRSGNTEFIQFLAIAKGSAGEVRAQLYVALDQNYITQAQFNDLADWRAK
jgi:four helix bundle protein